MRSENGIRIRNTGVSPIQYGTIEKILEVFKGEEIHIDPVLQTEVSSSSISYSPTLAKPSYFPPFWKRGVRGDFPIKIILQSFWNTILKTFVGNSFQENIAIRRSKAIFNYNRNFLNFIKKAPHDITDNDIKDYLLHLAKERQSAISTLNQAINALKFYYGTMLKKKFLYEIKRPRKDKKLPVVLSKEEVAKILSSVDNIKP